MVKQIEEPRISVRQRVGIQLSAEEVVHALRCWVAITLAAQKAVPIPKDFDGIVVNVSADDCGTLFGASITYEPQPEQPA